MKNILTCLPLVIACGACAADPDEHPLEVASEADALLRELGPEEVVGSISDGQTKILQYVGRPFYLAHVAVCAARGDVLEFKLTGTAPVRAVVTDELAREGVETEGRALTLRQTCRHSSEKYLIVVRAAIPQPPVATITVALTVVRAPVTPGPPPSFTIPVALRNRMIAVPMRCTRSWISGDDPVQGRMQDSNTVMMSVFFKDPAPYSYLAMVDIEEYPGEPAFIPGAASTVHAPTYSTRWPLLNSSTAALGPRTSNGEITFFGTPLVARKGFKSSWTLRFTAGPNAGDVLVKYSMGTTQTGSGVYTGGFACTGTMR
jgi:hypothetical protein